MLTLTCAHTTTTGKEKKTKNGEGISMLMDMHSNRLKKGSAATHRVTHKHTQISSLEATGRTRFKTRGGKCNSQECHSNQRGWQHSGRGKWTPARRGALKTTGSLLPWLTRQLRLAFFFFFFFPSLFRTPPTPSPQLSHLGVYTNYSGESSKQERERVTESLRA